MTLTDFVMKQSLNLFSALKLSQNFHSLDPEVWPQLEDYYNAKGRVSAVRVVNHCAERAVKLSSDFSTTLTHDENQRQLMYQVIEHHKKLITEPLKKNNTNSHINLQ